MQPWTALWVIKDVPNRGYEVIRDGRHVGIGRCDELDEAVDEIIRHDLYQSWDRVICRWDHHQVDVDVAGRGRELVGA